MYTRLLVSETTAKFLKWRSNKLDFYQHTLKENKTFAEKIFHPFAIHLGYKFNDKVKFQYILHIDQLRKYIVDFYYPRIKIAIEIDGNSHNSNSARYYDDKRTKLLSSKGILVLRFTNEQVKTDMLYVRAIAFDFFRSQCIANG